MADLQLDEEKLLARVAEAEKHALSVLEGYIEGMKREVKEAAAALRDLPDTATILRDAIGIASMNLEACENARGFHQPHQLEPRPISVAVGYSGVQQIGTVILPPDKPVRVLVLILPAKEKTS